MCELTEKIAELTLENDRIKKTSKQRFEQIKTLKEKEKWLDISNSHFRVLKKFLVENNFDIRYEHGVRERLDWSAMKVIESLMLKGKSTSKPSVDGLYAMKIDGEYKLANIHHNICWAITFLDNPDKCKGLHHYDVEDLVLIDSLAKG